MRGIVFDIDDTLYCRQDMLVRAAEMVLGVKIDDWSEFITVFYAKSELNMAGLESGAVSTRETNGWRYNETFRQLDLPYRECDGGLAADQYLELQSHMFISRGMAKSLDRFSEDPSTKLAILTAGESKHQWNKVDMLDLDRWFDRKNIIVTGDTPYTKPDIELFRMMEEKLELKPCELWMIGDSYKNDMSGAISSGWHTLWINRRNLPAPEKLPDITVFNDEDLNKALISL